MSGTAEPEGEVLARTIREQIRRPENICYLRSRPELAVSDVLPGRLQALLDQLDLAEAGKVARDRICSRQDRSVNTCREDIVVYAGMPDALQ